VADPVTYTKNLVRWDCIPGSIEGASRQAASLYGRGHVPIILPERGSADPDARILAFQRDQVPAGYDSQPPNSSPIAALKTL
jgi:hypothetical protein